MPILLEVLGAGVLVVLAGVGAYKITGWVRRINEEAAREFDDEDV